MILQAYDFLELNKKKIAIYKLEVLPMGKYSKWNRTY